MSENSDCETVETIFALPQAPTDKEYLDVARPKCARQESAFAVEPWTPSPNPPLSPDPPSTEPMTVEDDEEREVRLLSSWMREHDWVKKVALLFQERIVNIFRQYDEDNSGTIDRKELSNVMASMGYTLNESQLDDLLSQVDVDHNGLLDLGEFSTLLELWMQAAPYKIFDHNCSCAAEHIKTARQEKTSTFLPDVTWRWFWNSLLLIIAAYFWNVALVFDQIDESRRSSYSLYLLAPELIATVVLLAEIVFRCHLGFVDGGRTIVASRLVLREYARSWLAWDVVAMLPWAYFVPLGSVASVVLRHVRVLVVLRAMLEYSKEPNVSNISSAYVTFHYTVQPILKVVLVFVSIIHLAAVVHLAFVRYALREGCGDPREDSISAAVYFVMYIASGVGYGDILPHTYGQQWFTGVLCVFSQLTNGYFVGSLVNVMQEGDVESSRQSRLLYIEAILNFFEVPTKLQEEILQFQDHVLKHDLAASYTDIVDMLPIEMRFNILMQTRLPLLKEVGIFKNEHVNTLVQLAQQMAPFFCSPESYVALAGERSQELVIINYGFVDIFDGETGTYCDTIKSGSSFGEEGVLDGSRQTTHQFSYRALTFCDLYCLLSVSIKKLRRKLPRFDVDMGLTYQRILSERRAAVKEQSRARKASSEKAPGASEAAERGAPAEHLEGASALQEKRMSMRLGRDSLSASGMIMGALKRRRNENKLNSEEEDPEMTDLIEEITSTVEENRIALQQLTTTFHGR